MRNPMDTRRSVSRGVWLAIVLLQVAAVVSGLGVWFPALRQVCTEAVTLCRQQGGLTAADVAALNGLGWSLDAYAWYNLLKQVFISLLSMTLGVLVFWRRSGERMAWVASLFLFIGLDSSLAYVLSYAQPAWWLPTRVLQFTGQTCFALFLYLFPSGHFVPRWTRWPALLWVAIFFFINFFPGSVLDINQGDTSIVFLFVALIIGSFVVALVYRYRRVSTPVERTQTKWVVSAAVLGLALFIISLANILTKRGGVRITPVWPLQDWGFSALSVLLPVSIGIAILRYRLWDIDVIIRRTVVYGTLTALLLIVYFGGVVFLQQVFVAVTGQRSEVAIILSTLVIAALAVPLRSRIQALIDRRFFRRKYDAQQALEAFALTARDEVDAGQLTAGLMDAVEATLQPERVALWVRDDAPRRSAQMESRL